MLRIVRYLAMVIILMGVVGVVLGSVFITQGVEKASWMRQAMRIEKITLGLPEEKVKAGEIVDTAKEAQVAGDTVREHRRGIAPTYGDLLGSGRFDPTNPNHVTYMQALNLENYLYLAVLGFGVTDVVMATGAFMVVMGIALLGSGIGLFLLAKRTA